MILASKYIWRLIKVRPIKMILLLLEISLSVVALLIILNSFFAISNDAFNAEKHIFAVERKRTDFRAFDDSFVQSINKNNDYISKASLVKKVTQGQILDQGTSYDFNGFYGTDEKLQRILNYKIIEGKSLHRSDIENQRNVILLSEKVKKILFGEKNALGEKITVVSRKGFRRDYIVEGIFRLPTIYFELGLHFLVPESTITAPNHIEIWFNAKNISASKNEFKNLYREYVTGDVSNRVVNLNIGFTELFNFGRNRQIFFLKNYHLFFGLFAFLACVVSFMGLFSTMLSNIIKRTQEIGTRRALGASKVTIITQIIFESIQIMILGSIPGIIIALFLYQPLVENVILKNLFELFVSIEMNVSPESIALTLLITVLIGVLSGLYPAMMAASLSPVEALREE